MRAGAAGILAWAALVLGACSHKPPAPAAMPDLGEGDTAGYAAYRLENRSGRELSVVLEDTATRQILTVDLDKPRQEVHVARILKTGPLEMPDESATRPRLTILRLRPGEYRVKEVRARKGKRTEAGEGSGESFTVEKGMLTYLGEFQAESKVSGVEWGVSVETLDKADRHLEGIQGRIAVRKGVVRLR